MQKSLTHLFFFLLCGYVSFKIYPKISNEIRTKYPYALIGKDFGILTEDDLHTNQCVAYPTPFSPTSEIHSYPYWQCFKTNLSHVACEGRDYDESEKDFLSLFILSGIRDGQYHEYLTRRTISDDWCQQLRKEWRHLTKKQKYFCVSGSFIEVETKNGMTKFYWIFDKFKTKKGCESYFADDCSLQYHLKNGDDCGNRPQQTQNKI